MVNDECDKTVINSQHTNIQNTQNPAIYLLAVFLMLWLCKLCRCYYSLQSNVKRASVWDPVSPHHVFIPSWKVALPGLAVLFAIFNRVLQIRALIYKDACTIVALRLVRLRLQPDWRFHSPISAAFKPLRFSTAFNFQLDISFHSNPFLTGSFHCHLEVEI